MFITTNSSNNLIIGDQESIYIFKEIDLPKVHSIVKFMIKGKNEQLKELKLKLKLKLKHKDNKDNKEK